MGAMTTATRSGGFTRADLDAMPDDGRRYELIDGAIFVTPSPRFVHQVVAGNLYLRLHAQCPEELRLLFAPFDVALADDTVVEPDLVLAPRADFSEKDLSVAPMLAIEILSPSTRRVDLFVKRGRYEEAGVGAYWIVDPDEPSITAYELQDGVFASGPVARGEETFDVTFPFAVSFTPNELLT